MMYGENGYNGHSENVQKNGMNVWIYPPPSLKPAGKAFNVNNFCKNWGGKQLKSGDFGSRMFHGLQLVRRVAKGSKWHPKNDDLRGTAKYGTPPTNPTSGPTGTFQWDYKKVQYFMFSTGDFSEWMIVKRNMIDTKFGGPKDQQILCSSDYNTPKMFKQYYRNGANEDPWLSYKHHGTASMMYGENGYNGHSENVQKNGMNVWIYPPPSLKPAGPNPCSKNNGGCHSARKCTNASGKLKCGDCPKGWNNDGAKGCKKAPAGQMQKRVCEGKTMSIKCAKGVISVVKASYGRQHGKEVCPSTAIKTQDCHAVSSLKKVKQFCEGKSSCSVQSTNTHFGDPCGGTHKYLTVQYVCKAGKPAGFSVTKLCHMYGGKKMKSSDFKNNRMWGFGLARRVAKGSKWHPQNDDLRGTAKYGTPPTNPTSGATGTMQWDYKKVQYFMFSTGPPPPTLYRPIGPVTRQFLIS